MPIMEIIKNTCVIIVIAEIVAILGAALFLYVDNQTIETDWNEVVDTDKGK